MVPRHWRAYPDYRSRVFPQIRLRSAMDRARRADFTWVPLWSWAVVVGECVSPATPSRLGRGRWGRRAWDALSFRLCGHASPPFDAWRSDARADPADDCGRRGLSHSVGFASARDAHFPGRLSRAAVAGLRPIRSLAFSRIP